MQEIIRRRLGSGFVGRQDELARFRENLALPADDPRHRFVFNITGDPGVGKTFLVHRLSQVALELGARFALVDERVYDVPGAMAAIAGQLRTQGARLRTFEGRHQRYEERRLELYADPGAPSGAALLLARLAVRLGLRAAGTVPLLGMAAGTVDADLLIEQADQVHALLSRLRGRGDVRLVLAPVEELSPVFVSDLHRVAARRPLVLFFDAWERTGPLLDAWLLDLLDGRYGELPAGVTIVVAGREPLDPRRWASLLTEIERMEVGRFSDAEARQLLASKHIRDERVVEAIFALSGRLPLLVATLAEGSPVDPATLGEPGGGAVEQFLHWEADDRRREVALLAALPRRVDEDTLAVLASGEDVHDLYDWLRGLSFVREQDGVCQYHELVRATLVRLQRRRGPNAWRRRHRQLADHNLECQRALELPEEDGWTDAGWQRYAREETYHRLCAGPATALPLALGRIVLAYRSSRPLARRWAEMLAQAGRDAASLRLERLGTRLRDAAGGDEDCWADFLSILLQEPRLDDWARATALSQRAECHALDRDFDAALADLDRAIELDPQNAAVLALRGESYRLTGRRAEALADLTRALELRPGDAWALAHRAETHRLLGHLQEALADFGLAIELNPAYEWAYGSRAVTLRRLGRLPEALEDFTRALEISPDYDWALAGRGVTLRQLGRTGEALADLDRALALRPDYQWALVNRGVTLRQVGRYEEALADLDRAMAQVPEDAWALANRAETYHLLERHEEALADFDRALALRPHDAWALARRGDVHRRLGQPEAALADFERALALDAAEGAAHYGRALVLLSGGQAEEAGAELEAAAASARRSLEARPADPAAMLRLATYEVASGRPGEAPDLCRQAVAGGARGGLVATAIRDLREAAALTGANGTGIDSLVALLTAAS